jgi:predicted FMN-binding regulatory protein PaiB
MTTSVFAARTDADVARLVTEHPLAWVVPAADPAHAMPLPLRIERAQNGRIATLTGHAPRRFPQVEQLRADPRATLLFMGPHGYVSPSWFHDRTQAPTWNFAIANFDVRIEFLDTPEDLDRIVRDLVDAMEAGRPNPWRVEDMHARYAQLLQRIIPFRATVVSAEGKFKLGQDERDDTWPEIIDGLTRGGHDALVALMNEFNPQRAVRGDRA